MSRHRKQRNRRFQRKLATVSETSLDVIAYRVRNTGRMPSWATPLERIAYIRLERQCK
jgi:hypothetical protein